MIYPKMIRRNHRRRGPLESLKDNNFYSGLENAIKELSETLDNHGANADKIIGYMNSDEREVSMTRINRMEKDISELEDKIYG